MSKKKRQLQVCMKTARDGRRCGRYCAQGKTLCSVHDPTRAPYGVIKDQETQDLGELLRRLTKHSDPAIRLRAIEAILKREEQGGCVVCKARADRDRQTNAFVCALTDDERARLAACLDALDACKATIYARDESLRPDDAVRVIAQPTGSPDYVPPDAVVRSTDDEPEPEPIAQVTTASGDEIDDADWKPV